MRKNIFLIKILLLSIYTYSQQNDNVYSRSGLEKQANHPSVEVFTPPSVSSILGPELVNSAKVDKPVELKDVQSDVNAIVRDIKQNTSNTLRNMQNIENSKGSTYKDPNYAGDEIARSINPNHGKIKLTKNIPITETHEVLSDGVTWVPKDKIKRNSPNNRGSLPVNKVLGDSNSKIFYFFLIFVGLMVFLIIITLMILFFKDRNKMLHQQVDTYGGMTKKYKIFLEHLMTYPNAKIINQSRTNIHIKSVLEASMIDFYIDETFQLVVIECRASMSFLGSFKKKWEFPHSLPQTIMICEIENFFNKEIAKNISLNPI